MRGKTRNALLLDMSSIFLSKLQIQVQNEAAISPKRWVRICIPVQSMSFSSAGMRLSARVSAAPSSGRICRGFPFLLGAGSCAAVTVLLGWRDVFLCGAAEDFGFLLCLVAMLDDDAGGFVRLKSFGDEKGITGRRGATHLWGAWVVAMEVVAVLICPRGERSQAG